MQCSWNSSEQHITGGYHRRNRSVWAKVLIWPTCTYSLNPLHFIVNIPYIAWGYIAIIFCSRTQIRETQYSPICKQSYFNKINIYDYFAILEKAIICVYINKPLQPEAEHFSRLRISLQNPQNVCLRKIRRLLRSWAPLHIQGELAGWLAWVANERGHTLNLKFLIALRNSTTLRGYPKWCCYFTAQWWCWIEHLICCIHWIFRWNAAAMVTLLWFYSPINTLIFFAD